MRPRRRRALVVIASGVLLFAGCRELVCPEVTPDGLGAVDSVSPDGGADIGRCACFIDGNCHVAGAVSPGSSCWSCDPARDYQGWSERCTWQETRLGAGSELTGVHGSGPDDIYVATLDGVLRRFDGAAWRVVDTKGAGCAAYHDVLVLGPRRLIAVGRVGVNGCSAQLESGTWRRLEVAEELALHRVWRAPSGRIFALGRSRPWQLDDGTWKAWQKVEHPKLTTMASIFGNLDANTPLRSHPPWNPYFPDVTSDFSFSLPVYDSLGKEHIVGVYFSRSMDHGGGQTWDYHVLAKGEEVTGGWPGTPKEGHSGVLTFDMQGRLLTEASSGSGFNFLNATPAQAIHFDFGDSLTTDGGTGSRGLTNYASSSVVWKITQDGRGAVGTPSFTLDRRSAIAHLGDEVFIVGATASHGEHAVGWSFAASAFTTTPLLGGAAGLWSDSQQLFAVGLGGRILHYDGHAWLEQVPRGEKRDDLWSVWGSGPADVYAGGRGQIRRFDGRRWTTIYKRAGLDLSAIWGLAPDEIYAVGSGGTLLRYSSKGP